MTETIGLVVQAKVKGQPGAMDKLKKDVTKSVSEGTKLGGMKLPGILGDLVGSSERTASSLNQSGMSKGSSWGGGTMGKMAAGVFVLFAILAAVKGIFEKMVQSSAILKGTMDMLNQGFNLLIRPISDSIGRFLRPMAEAIIEQGLRNIEKYDQAQATLEESGITGTLQDFLLVVYELMDITTIGAQLLSQVFAWAGEAIYNAAAGFLTWFIDGLTGIGNGIVSILGNIGEMFVNALNNIAPGLGDAMSGLFSQIADFGGQIWDYLASGFSAIGDALGQLGGWIWDTLISFLGDPLGQLAGFAGWLWDSIVAGFSTLGSIMGQVPTFIYNTIVDGLKGLANILTDVGKKFYNWVYNSLAGVFNSIHNFSMSILGQTIMPFTAIPLITYLAQGGITNGPTMAMIGEGKGGTQREVVSPLSDLIGILQQAGAGGGTVVEWHQHGAIYGVNDLERAMDAAIEKANRKNRGTVRA